MDFCLMLARSSSATPTLTSPSSNASRISASAASRCSSVSFPCPRKFLNVRCSFSVKFSNISAFSSSQDPPLYRSVAHTARKPRLATDPDQTRAHYPHFSMEHFPCYIVSNDEKRTGVSTHLGGKFMIHRKLTTFFTAAILVVAAL